MEHSFTITLTDTPNPEDVKAVSDGLDGFNAQHGALNDWAQLVMIVKNEQGRVVAGLTGGTYWGWLYVARLWVDESLRGQGWGSRPASSLPVFRELPKIRGDFRPRWHLTSRQSSVTLLSLNRIISAVAAVARSEHRSIPPTPIDS